MVSTLLHVLLQSSASTCSGSSNGGYLRPKCLRSQCNMCILQSCMTHLCNAQYQTVMQVGLEKARLARHVLHQGMWLDDFYHYCFEYYHAGSGTQNHLSSESDFRTAAGSTALNTHASCRITHLHIHLAGVIMSIQATRLC